jgi:hypothetical protein
MNGLGITETNHLQKRPWQSTAAGIYQSPTPGRKQRIRHPSVEQSLQDQLPKSGWQKEAD